RAEQQTALSETQQSPSESLVLGVWYQESGTRSLVPDSWYQTPGARSLVPGVWYQTPGTRLLVPGVWYQESGTRTTKKRVEDEDDMRTLASVDKKYHVKMK
ncbi:hypothetical protein JOQ06_010001, partial [Pogonophryne albipinna]